MEINTDELLLAMAFIFVIAALYLIYRTSLNLKKSEFIVSRILRQLAINKPSLFELVTRLHNDVISKDDLLKLEYLAIKTIEGIRMQSYPFQFLGFSFEKKTIITGITQTNLNARKLYMKKLFNFDVSNTFDEVSNNPRPLTKTPGVRSQNVWVKKKGH